MPRNPTPLQFPTQGVVENAPFSHQPPGTTPSALNVRSYDALERRNRGGQRTGVSRVANDAINGSNQIQMVEPIVEAIDLVQAASWGDKLTDPAGPLSGSGGKMLWASDGTFLVQMATGSGIRVWPVTGNTYGAGITLAHSTITAALGAGNVQDIDLSNDNDYLFIATSGGLGVCTIDPSSGFGAITEFGSLTSVTGVRASSDGNAVLYIDQTGTALHAVRWTGTAFGTAFSDPAVGSLGGSAMALAADNSVVFVTNQSGSGSVQAWNFNTSTGFGSQIDTVLIGAGGSNVNELAAHPSLSHVSIALSTSNEYQIYSFSVSTGFGAVSRANAGVGTLEATSFSPSGSYLFVGGGTSPRGKVFNFAGGVGSALADPGTLPSTTAYSGQWKALDDILALSVTNVVETWDFTPAGINPSARETRLVTVTGGSMYRSSTDFATFSLVASGSSAFDSSAPTLQGGVAFQKMFVVDGIYANYQFLDFSDNTLKDWTANLTAGTLPRGTTDNTLGARIIAVYRGRVCLSGLKEEPQNWFMSKAGDPFDFDYSPTTPSAVQAVAGNNSEVGELGDIVTALAPYQDDLLVMGGANSVWVMRGDPAAGGQIDNIVRGIGIVGPDAWCFDDVGNFYFFGVNGLYRISYGLNSQPELVSKNKLDRTFSEIDVSAVGISLEYDPLWQGVHVFVLSTSEPASDAAAPRHYFWDSRNQAFWPDQYPAAVGPSATVYLNTDNPEESGVVFGGFDGRVRRFDDGAKSDDGTAITSFVQIPAIAPGAALADTKLSEVAVNLDVQSDNMTLNVYAGQNIEEAVNSGVVRYSRDLLPGRNNSFRNRVRGAAIVLELRQSVDGDTWAYENGVALVEPIGKTRRRRQ